MNGNILPENVQLFKVKFFLFVYIYIKQNFKLQYGDFVKAFFDFWFEERRVSCDVTWLQFCGGFPLLCNFSCVL
jgi:hypothetical protein